MKIFIFSIINYIAGFHLLPEFTDVEEFNTLKTTGIRVKAIVEIEWKLMILKVDGPNFLELDR